MSYAELITQAINSSPEKRMTLSEIYNWMVLNVKALSDKRHFFSPNGWKNSVRYNLSWGSQFQRVKRYGMNKPSWWTVDMSKVKKGRRRNLNADVNRKTTLAASFNNQMISNQSSHNNFKSVSVTAAGRFQHRVHSLDCNNPEIAASVAVGQFSSCNTSNRNNAPSMYVAANEIQQQQFIPTPITNNFFDIWQHNDNDQYSINFCRHRSLSSCSFSSNETSSDHLIEKAYTSPLSTKINPCRLTEDITVNLQNANNFFDRTINRPTITLNISDDCLGNNLWTQGINCFQTKTLSEQPNNFEDINQVISVQLDNGTLLDIMISAPVQLKVVVSSENSCQTDDLENHLHQLNLSSPFSNTNNQSEINCNASCESEFRATVVSNDILTHCNIIPELFLDYNEPCTVNSETNMEDDMWFIEAEQYGGDNTDNYNSDFQFVI